MANNLKEPDDSLDFTLILTNPSLAVTQSWMVAEAMDSRLAAGGTAPQPYTSKLNEHFLIGGAESAAGSAGAVRRLQRRSGVMVPPRDAPILVVDGDLVTRKLLERLLVTEGYAVRGAGNRDEFIAAMRLVPQPALILLEVNMPDMNGFAALTRMRQHESFRNTHVVLMTSRTAPDDVARAFKLGADGYLSKPFKVGVVRNLLIGVFGEQ
jgi:CheY-like chemotaxis protein